MSKGLIATLGVTFIVVVMAVGLFIMYLTYSNAEIRQRNLVLAKQKDNTSQLDNTIKTISQTAQVTQEQREALKDIIVGNAEARATKGGSLATFVHEAVPNIDTTTATYRQLMNIITAARATWTENQRQLIDLNREHDNMIDVAPSSWFVGGRGKIDIVIVTSSRTKESFRTGEDNDTELFPKKNKPAEK